MFHVLPCQLHECGGEHAGYFLLPTICQTKHMNAICADACATAISSRNVWDLNNPKIFLCKNLLHLWDKENCEEPIVGKACSFQGCPYRVTVQLSLSLWLHLFVSLSPSVTLYTHVDITVQVELLVRAHDCYTLGCSVDGISEVLLVVRQWVPNLILLKLFSLVVSVPL